MGGTLKRTANRKVLHGRDIKDAISFKETLEEEKLNISVFHVPTDMVEEKRKLLPSLKSIPGTMKIHQIITNKPGEIAHRSVSCTCNDPSTHSCHDLKKFVFDSHPANTASSTPMNRAKDSIVALSVEDQRAKFFEETLQAFAKTFDEILTLSMSTENLIKSYEICEFIPSLHNTGLSVDEISMSIYPADITQEQVMYTVSVSAYGNCLPYTGSVHAFGTEKRGAEMRVRIVTELALHQLFLDQTYLQRGLDVSTTNLPMRYAMYSESYLPGLLLNATSINILFQNEVVNVSRDKCYMGIWQLFALSSILKRPIVSVYPQLGNPSVRMDLNRTIFPREEQRSNKAFIMWISTRTDMVHVHWVPNHFIPVLPTDVVHKPSDIEIQRWRLKAQRTKEKVKTEKDMNSNGMFKSAEEEKKT